MSAPVSPTGWNMTPADAIKFARKLEPWEVMVFLDDYDNGVNAEGWLTEPSSETQGQDA